MVVGSIVRGQHDLHLLIKTAINRGLYINLSHFQSHCLPSCAHYQQPPTRVHFTVVNGEGSIVFLSRKAFHWCPPGALGPQNGAVAFHMSLCDISIVQAENTHAAPSRRRCEKYEFWQRDIYQRGYSTYHNVPASGFTAQKQWHWEERVSLRVLLTDQAGFVSKIAKAFQQGFIKS